MPLPLIEHVASVLHKCRVENLWAGASSLYVFMRKGGLEAHKLLGNNVVLMLVNFRSLLDAEKVFERLTYRNQWSWNAIITGNIKHERPDHALILYQKFQHDTLLHPTVHTFLALLQACSKLKALEKGLDLHAEISRTGLLTQEPFVGSTLVDMYAKCGLLANSQEVFDQLTVRDVVSWNALIAGYSRHNLSEKALSCFEWMQLDGFSPDVVSFVCALKACGTIGRADTGQELHAAIEKKGLYRENPFLGNALIDMYAKCGLLANAQLIFDKVQAHDVISWNVLIAGYCEHGQGMEALHLFDRMQHDGVSPDAVTFVCSLKACGNSQVFQKGQEIHAEVARKGMMKRESIGNTLVDMYAKCGLLAKAQEVFNDLCVHNVVSWNAIMAGYSDYGYGEDTLRCYEQMQLDGVSPDAATSICSLKACGSLRAIDKGLEIHAEIDRKDLLKMDIAVGGALVDMYARCGLLTKAQEVFERLPIKDNVSWTALIAGYAGHGHGDLALKYFEQMQLDDVTPDVVTFVCSLKACGYIGASDKGQELHATIEQKGCLQSDLVVGNCLVDMYGRSGLLDKAQRVFDKLLVRDVVSWNSLIAGYAEHGLGNKAIECFEQMQHSGLSPDYVTYVNSLKACGSIGAIEKGQEIQVEIERKGLLERDVVIGNTLVNMYAKCGSLRKAQEVFDKLLVKDVISWNTLIAGFAQLGWSNAHILDRMLGEGNEPDAETFVTILNGCSRTGLVDKGKTYFEAMSKDHGIVPTREHLTCMIDLLCHTGHLDKAVAWIKRYSFCSDLVMWYTLFGACIKCGSVELATQVFEQAFCFNQVNAASCTLLSNSCKGGALMQEGLYIAKAARMEGPGHHLGVISDVNGIIHSPRIKVIM